MSVISILVSFDYKLITVLVLFPYQLLGIGPAVHITFYRIPYLKLFGTSTEKHLRLSPVFNFAKNSSQMFSREFCKFVQSSLFK